MLNLLCSDLIVPEVGSEMGGYENYALRRRVDVFVIIGWVCSMTVLLKLQG